MHNKAKPRVYIGSSTEGLRYARAISRSLSEYAEAMVWRDGVFQLGEATIESLERAVEEHKFDFAILVCTPDDEYCLRPGRPEARKGFVPRDNVLMEVGFFIARLGRTRTFVIRHPDVELPSNLSGVTTAKIVKSESGHPQEEVAGACFEIGEAIQRRMSQDLSPRRDPRNLGGFGTDMVGYTNIGESEFAQCLTDWVRTSEEITFVGTGLNILFSGELRGLIVRRAAAGKMRATICFGNPFSPHVTQRLVEEERCQAPPHVAAEGIVNRVKALLHETVDVPNVEVKLFNNYPTMSIFRFDNSRFVYYPMGYRMLGNLCPATIVRRPGSLCDFLEEMIHYYLEDAVDARELFRVRVRRERSKRFVHPESIRQVALYAIPHPDSNFYRRGAALLGYDVFTRSELKATPELQEFRQHVGAATKYGFHLTIADVMFLEQSQIPSLMCEIREIASSIPRFELGIDELSCGRFWRNSLELRCSEKSGQLERLLAEIAVKIRPQALGTNYTLDPEVLAQLKPLDATGRTMLDAYQSPYVLGSFEPHFTLCTPEHVEEEVMERMKQLARSQFQRYLDGEPVPIDRLWLLERSHDAQVWDEICEKTHVVWLK